MEAACLDSCAERLTSVEGFEGGVQGWTPQKTIYQVPKPPGRGKYPNYVASNMPKKK
jgi:hypothetical protein